MYAVVETGGKQYKVSPGEVLFVEKLPYPEGTSISLERVLMVVDDDGSGPEEANECDEENNTLDLALPCS